MANSAEGLKPSNEEDDDDCWMFQLGDADKDDVDDTDDEDEVEDVDDDEDDDDVDEDDEELSCFSFLVPLLLAFYFN